MGVKKAASPALPPLFRAALEQAGLPLPIPELRFHEERRWRLDWAWPEHLVALEIEGGVWVQGRHTRGSGFVKDMEKYNEATARGWRILRVEPKALCTPATMALIRRALDA